MFNLSDKELDRLAREAATEYDPGDLTGPGSWDRLQLRLDTEIGYPRLNFFRSLGRMSFYYAPAILLLAGASYFLFRSTRSHPATHPPGSPATTRAEPSGSPPVIKITPIQPSSANVDRSIKNQNSTYRPTFTPSPVRSASGATKDPYAGQGSPSARSGLHQALTNASGQTALSGKATASGQTTAFGQPTASGKTRASEKTTAPEKIAASGKAVAAGNKAEAQNGSLSTQADAANSSNRGETNGTSGSPTNTIGSATNASGSGTPNPASGATHASNRNRPDNGGSLTGHITNSMTGTDQTSDKTSSAPAHLSHSMVDGIKPLGPQSPAIDDSALRTLSPPPGAKTAELVNPGKPPPHSLHIDRRLQLGLSVAPDFTSVNSLAGDKPGSIIGITVGYQFFSRWHLQTGFLLAHRNYAAAQEDYHVPYDYYRMNNMHDVYFVKGNLDLFEIPLNLRYDFSIAGNTSFFVSGGISSYLLRNENCDYYFDLFGRTVYEEFKYGHHQNSLFSTVNLSMGVETGLTNSLSLLIAPYIKMPTAGLGFGRMEMNSVGVEFGLKYSPILRRKRR
jgi:hypothetical protein